MLQILCIELSNELSFPQSVERESGIFNMFWIIRSRDCVSIIKIQSHIAL